MRVSTRNPVLVAAAAVASMGCAARLADSAALPTGYCARGPVPNYMAARAQQCWYEASGGRWRIVNHEFHYDVLVMQAEASTLDLTDDIVRRVIEVHGERFVEILIYVRSEAGKPATIRRARWIGGGGVEHIDFAAS
jgi:hypothetical protein